jgi:oligopeptide/dipeptide ABC transporter ATP-binding protein
MKMVDKGGEKLLEIKDLSVRFHLNSGLIAHALGQDLKTVHAVDNVNLTIMKGRTLGLVGESGSGKSTIGNAIFGLVDVHSGSIKFNDKEILSKGKMTDTGFKSKAHFIFQNPFSCLNPRMTAWEIIAEPMIVYPDADRNIARRVAELMDAVKLPTSSAMKFPHEFSGGQARRIGLARALALNPSFIVADEPTSGLDISTSATILNLMRDMQEEFGLTYLWISHNLDQVQHMSDDMAVLYLGQVIEFGKTADILANMQHPYTEALVSAVPTIGGRGSSKKKIILQGEIPSPINRPTGCHFRTRCPYVQTNCATDEPELGSKSLGQLVRCHYPL